MATSWFAWRATCVAASSTGPTWAPPDMSSLSRLTGLGLPTRAPRAALLRITDLPRRVGCGVGLIHRSWVYVVPEGVRFGASGAAPDIGSVLVKGEVRNDVSARTPRS